jgi:two-component sensor histidine kinase
MFSLAELARAHTALREPDIDHLQRLVAGWGLLADLSFSDLLLYAPCEEVAGEGPPDGRDVAARKAPGPRGARQPRRSYVVLAQVRPSTTQTVYQRDLVGVFTNERERPLIDRTYRGGEIVNGGNEDGPLAGPGGGATVAGPEVRLHLVGVPIRYDGRVVAVVSSEGVPGGGRRHGSLEQAYLASFERFARMIALGEFPFSDDHDPTKELPRVGDGAVLLDRDGAIEYSSPNANSAFHRLGVLSQTVARTLADLGLDDSVVRHASLSRTPATSELSRGNHNHVLAHCIPMLERGTVVGSLLLLRDISDLKRLDRLLVSKDTHIREIHHRVKNNLQTISSLLRIQARRVGSAEARTVIEESVRRIGSIAVVHETLSQEAGDAVPFGEIARPIIRMVEESLVSPERPIYFRLSGDAITLPAPVATPLALVLTELLQNAVDHAYPSADSGADGFGPDGGDGDLHGDGGDGGARSAGQVQIDLAVRDGWLGVTVRDDGAGLPDGFAFESSTGLGLSIVRTLVEHEMLGRIAMRAAGDGAGTIVDIEVPLDGAGTAR